LKETFQKKPFRLTGKFFQEGEKNIKRLEVQVSQSEERRTAWRRAGAKRQLVLYLTDPLLASLISEHDGVRDL